MTHDLEYHSTCTDSKWKKKKRKVCSKLVKPNRQFFLALEMFCLNKQDKNLPSWTELGTNEINYSANMFLCPLNTGSFINACDSKSNEDVIDGKKKTPQSLLGK